MQKTLITLLILIGISWSVFAQDPSVLNARLEECRDARCEYRVLKKLFDYYVDNNLDSIGFYSERLRLTAVRAQDDSLLLAAYRLKGGSFLAFQQFDSAQHYAVRALQHSRSEAFPRLKADLTMLQSSIYGMTGNADLALEVAKSSRALSIADNYAKGVVNANGIIIRTLTTILGDTLSARPYVDETIEYVPLLRDSAMRNIYTSTVGGYLQGLFKDYEGALPWLQQAYEEGRKMGPYYTDHPALNLSNLYLEGFRDYEQALRYARIAVEAAAAYNNYEDMSRAQGQKALAFAKLERYDSAYQASMEYIDFLNLSYQEAVNRNISDAQVQFETQEKELQLIRQKAQLDRQYLVIAIVVALAALLLLLSLYWRQRQRRQQLELQVQTTEARRLREIDTFKSDMLAKLSHELRTPLTLMLGPLGNWKHDRRHFNADRELPRMTRNAQRLRELVDQLLDLAKLEHGEMLHHPRAANLSEIVRRSVGFFHTAAEESRVELVTTVPGEEIWAVFDPDYLQKILTNLVSNALKHTPAGGRVDVEVESVANAKYLFRVKDTGSGMVSAETELVFERFYQIDRGREGMGLGLALVKQLVDRQRGSIRIDSRVGRGTTVTVELPMQTVTPPANIIEAEAPSVTTLVTDKRPRILVVEDHPDVRAFIVETLARDFEVLTADDYESGLQSAIDSMPDLITLDVVLPDRDGFTLARALAEDARTSHIPVILLTALSGEDNREAGLKTGVVDYLEKPFQGAELIQKIQNLLNLRRQWWGRFQQRLLHPAEKELTSLDDRFLADLQQRIHERMEDEAFSVDELASLLHLSRSQLYRKVQALTGKSPSAWLRHFRLQEAHRLLSGGSAEVTEVAFRTGFKNASHFSTAFRKQYGYPPSEIKAD